MDIGQCIAVIDSHVIAVEALEGTNLMIERAGKLCRRVVDADQSLQTVSGHAGGCAEHRHDDDRETPCRQVRVRGAGCGKTICLRRRKVIELADRYRWRSWGG